MARYIACEGYFKRCTLLRAMHGTLAADRMLGRTSCFICDK